MQTLAPGASEDNKPVLCFAHEEQKKSKDRKRQEVNYSLRAGCQNLKIEIKIISCHALEALELVMDALRVI